MSSAPQTDIQEILLDRLHAIDQGERGRERRDTIRPICNTYASRQTEGKIRVSVYLLFTPC